MRTPLPTLNRGNASLWLVLMLFVFKAMVPQGFMPVSYTHLTLPTKA